MRRCSGGRPAASLAFFSVRVASEEWWRLLTFPFGHVTWYHLLLDGTAFLILFAELAASSLWRKRGDRGVCRGEFGRRAHVAAHRDPGGLCGSSGITHGLMATSAIAMICHGDQMENHAGWIALAIVVAKSAAEAVRTRDAVVSSHRDGGCPDCRLPRGRRGGRFSFFFLSAAAGATRSLTSPGACATLPPSARWPAPFVARRCGR